MKVPKLNPIKIYYSGDFKKDEYMSREGVMMCELQQHVDENMIGVVTFKDGHTETLGSMNFLLGRCDCCSENDSDVKSVAVYQLG
jgi:hypothetical protein